MPSPGRYLHWDCETRSTVDLRATGAYVYAAHPSTEVTVARLALDREAPVEWRPGQDLSPRFHFALADSNVEVVAHNAAFERLMLEHILHPRHGWPLVPIDRWICTMARCRAMALPGALENAAIAAGLDIKKDNAGRQLMLRMCRPRGINADGSPVWWTDPERMDRLSDYCATDVKVERALMLATVPLPIDELDVWDLTEVMNDRGVRFDLDFVRAARAVALTTTGMLDRQIAEITGGVVTAVSAIGALKTWLHRRGVDLSPPPELVRGPVSMVLDTLTEASAEASEVAALERAIGVDDEVEAEEALPELRRRDIIRLLADPRVGGLERQALRCRFEGGKISVKKLDAIVNRADAGGVVRGLLSYHGASTGRYISQGLQVQNFPRDVVRDWDGHRTLLDHGAAMVDAIGGPPLDVISRMLRGAIVPRDGHEIATCDFSSVEAVGVAWLAGQSDLVDAFRSKRKIYEEMAGAVYNRRASDIAKDSTERQVGKTSLAAGTQVLTDAGWVCIEDVTLSHRLWDGVEWVNHDGPIANGLKKTMTLSGVSLTPDHRVWCGTEWREARYLAPAAGTHCLKSALASVRLPSPATSLVSGKASPTSSSVATVAARSTRSLGTTSRRAGALGATVARNWRDTKSDIGSSLKRCLTTAIGRACSIVFPPPSRAATFLGAGATNTTAFAGFLSGLSGEKTGLPSSASFRHCLGGTIRPSTWTGPATTETTNPETSNSSLDRRIWPTGAISTFSRVRSAILRPVYDLTNAGPRHRFTILSDDGPLIVSNCILGCGYQMGWWKFRETCLVQAGVLLSPEEAAHAIDTYRQTFPEIPKLWRQLNRAAIRAVKNPGLVVDAAGGKIRFRRDPLWLRMRLPGGRYLWYARPLIEKGRFDTDTVTYMSVNAKTRRWERTQTYGGRLTENCISIGTSVLTDRGWLAIETVRLADRLWDGEAWVRHDGLIAKGEQDIIEIDGVGMTPDHELLTTEGWKSGASCDGLDRAPVALPDSAVSRWEHATTESPLVLPLRVRRDDDRRRGGYPQGQGEVLWLPDESPAFNAPDDAWYVEAPGLRGLALHGGPLPAADASGMAELRRAGDYGLPRVAALPSLLAGDGVNVSARADPGAHRQHARLFGGELRVAHAEGAGAEHSGQCADQHPMGPHDHRGSGGAQRYRKDDATLSPESGRARVYDVLNAGPRHRFVVAGATGPLIVHNCVQGLCRDLLVRAAMGLEQAGYQPITLIHDEVVAEPPIGHGSVGEMCEIMCALPGWARGFPLSASGARGPRYIKT